MNEDERADMGYGAKPVTLLQFIEGADHHYHTVREVTEGDYRIGQAYMNYLSVHFPEAARRIVMTATDPFHNDGRLGAMLDYIVEEEVVLGKLV